MIDIEKIREAQNILEQALLELKRETSETINKKQPIEGVNVFNSRAATVSFSALLSNNSWAPSTYLPACQVEAVENVTKNITSFDSFVDKIRELIEKKEIKTKNEYVRLNPNTIKALEEVLDKIF